MHAGQVQAQQRYSPRVARLQTHFLKSFQFLYRPELTRGLEPRLVGYPSLR